MILESDIRQVYNLLQHKGKWYIDFSVDDENPKIHKVAEKAKLFVDKNITRFSVSALSRRYNKWEKDPEYISCDECFFLFLNWLAYKIGRTPLKKEEKLIYDESVNLTIKFLKQ